MTIADSSDALSLEETMIRQARESFQRLPTLEIIIDRLLLALVPDLVSEMPGLIPIEVHGSELPMAPCAFSGRLRAPLAQTLLTRLEEAHAGRAVEPMRALSPAALEDDALVRVLCELLCESAVYGIKAQTLVVLEFSRQCSGSVSYTHLTLPTNREV